MRTDPGVDVGIVDASPPRGADAPLISPIRQAATVVAADVDAGLGSGSGGLSTAEAHERLERYGENVIHMHRARPWHVLLRQLRSPILLLLFATATIAALVGDSTDAAVIAVILVVSVVLGFVNEFRAERAADAMHDRLRHMCVVIREGARRNIDVTEIVPGDRVVLSVGTVVPADLRLVACDALRCDEGILTGESVAVEKSTAAVAPGTGVGDLTGCALMGTVVHAGGGVGVVVATGSQTEFGRIAVGLSAHEPQTEFQRGLGQFSSFLLIVALVLTTGIFVTAVLLGRPIIESLLFSLAIAVGITPQLLPAVVSTSLAAGSKAMARRRVLVKRMVCIEDLGDLDLLVTDKTGTLTTGRIEFERAVPVEGAGESRLLALGILASDVDPGTATVVGLNTLDAALAEVRSAADDEILAFRRIDVLPFDHERRRSSAIVAADDGGLLVVKGAPESVLPLCGAVSATSLTALEQLYEEGCRVVAVATRSVGDVRSLEAGEEHDLLLRGFLVFTDAVKIGAADSLRRLSELGVAVKIATGDSAAVAEHVWERLGMPKGVTLTGDQVDALDDRRLTAAAVDATIFARVSPEQKARVIRALRHKGRAVGFLGDGVNDALALHRADIGISVDSAVDVAKDAADVLLLDKDLDVLAAGVTEGRRIFANTIKYVMMGTSSNFGNMFSASIASVILPFLPMLPGQILLNNLLYDSSQLAIPTDRVDAEQLRAPSHWDIGAIRRFMLLFGPISSIFDFATFWMMLTVFHAAPPEFRSGWFIESIATQTLIVFAVRTRRVPFLRSRPSLALTVSVLGVVLIGALLPYSPLSALLGFSPLPAPFFLALVAMILGYLVLVETAKVWYFRKLSAPVPTVRRRGLTTRVLRRAARFTERSAPSQAR